MPIAIHEDHLRGSTPLEKFQHARDLGAQGVELWAAGLTENVPAIAAAMQQTGLRTAAINHGRQRNLLDPDPDERERALKQLREFDYQRGRSRCCGGGLRPHVRRITLS